MLKAVCDTNVIISAVIAPTGPPYEVLAAWRRGAFSLLISEPLLAEVVHVLGRPYFCARRGVTDERIARLRRLLLTDAVVVETTSTLRHVAADPDEDRVIECALDGEADHIVSGDRHLLGLGAFRHMLILSPGEFLVALAEHRGLY